MSFDYLVVPFHDFFAVATKREDGSLNYLTSGKTQDEASTYAKLLADALLIA